MEIPRYITAVRYLDRYSPDGFLRAGGMAAIEQEAADQAIRDEREAWLPILERWLKEAMTNNEHPLMCAILESQIRRLRRLLHLPPYRGTAAIERRRELTRERVRRYRQRRKLTDPAEAMAP